MHAVLPVTAATVRVCTWFFMLLMGLLHACTMCMHLTLHDACSNSWSDTVRVKGPTGTRRVKGGVSGLAEDLRPVSEVEAGVNFRPAGCCTGAGCRFTFPGGNQVQVPGKVKGRCGHTFPSTRRFLVSLISCHLDHGIETSGNRWAGRRCVEPHNRDLGAEG